MSANEYKRPKPLIFGCAGTRLNALERGVFRDANPFGFILFKRNCESPDQVRYLVMELQQTVGRDDIQIAIDQEGGRVSRLQPPHWPTYPPARSFGMMYERDPEWGMEAIKLYARLLCHELGKIGVTLNCAPVVDIFNSEGTPAIGDRAYSDNVSVVAASARTLAETFMENGIVPVLKHLPGHGKLTVDPHHVLPTITASRAELETQDFMPFELLKDIPLGMNSHAIFTALDHHHPASLSPYIINDIIRDKIGFDGLLLSDDLTMKALKGTAADLARQALDAGNDIILHCSGDTSEMEAINRVTEPMSDAAWARWQHAAGMIAPRNPAYDPRQDAERLDILLGGLAFGEVG